MYRFAAQPSQEQELEIMHSLGRYASGARWCSLFGSAAAGLLLFSPWHWIYPPAHIFMLTYLSLSLIVGYAIHLTAGRLLARYLVGRRAVELADRAGVSADAVAGLACAYVV